MRRFLLYNFDSGDLLGRVSPLVATRCMSCMSGPQVLVPLLKAGATFCSVWSVPEACMGLFEVGGQCGTAHRHWPGISCCLLGVIFLMHG